MTAERGHTRPWRTGARAAMLLALLLLGPGMLALSAAGGSIVVEDWSRISEGTKGIPAGWQGQKWGSPKYDFAVVADGGVKALKLRSEADSSTISKEIKVDVMQHPVLEWRWKVLVLPPRGDARRAETDDEAAQLYVTFPRFPSQVRSRIIGYIWDSNAPVGTTFPSAKVGTVAFVVVRSGPADLGKWLTESRNVRDDYRRIYGEEPKESAGAISLSINSQNTGARAEALFGEILFRAP